MIPLKLDVVQILGDLNRAGWLDYKVELACSLPRGWISKLRNGTLENPTLPNAARLFNFWFDECSANPQTQVETT